MVGCKTEPVFVNASTGVRDNRVYMEALEGNRRPGTNMDGSQKPGLWNQMVIVEMVKQMDHHNASRYPPRFRRTRRASGYWSNLTMLNATAHDDDDYLTKDQRRGNE